jgi:hypothetical protein
MAGRDARPNAGTADDSLESLSRVEGRQALNPSLPLGETRVREQAAEVLVPQPVRDEGRDSRMARAGIHRSAIGGAVTMLAVLAMLPAVASAGATPADIVDYFRVYYQTQVANAPEFAALDFLRSAAANHVAVTDVLKPGATRAVVVDRRNGYLRISDSSATDQELTMAFYTTAGGRRLVVVGGSACADGCDFLMQFFSADGGGLKPVPRQSVMPPVGPSDFIKAGHPIPKALWWVWSRRSTTCRAARGRR